MFIAHLPAGYLLRAATAPRQTGALTTGAWIVGSVLPDVDILFFYLIDHRAHVHHSYYTHIPLTWLVLTLAGLAGTTLVRRLRALRPAAALFFACVWLHLVLDSVASEIFWLYPWSTRGFSLFRVPAVHAHWVLNYLLHWTFALEIALVIAAAAVFAVRRRRLPLAERCATPGM